MTTDILSILFEDFNERAIAPVEPAAEEAPPPIGNIDEIRQEAWTEGYLKGRLQTGAQNGDPELAARLLSGVHDLDATAAKAVEAASLAVADMLVNSFIAAASGDWSERLPDRVRMVADRIKPAMTIAPDFELRAADGTIRHFGNVTEFSRALEAGDAADDVTIRWQRGEATISRTALMEDLREAILPLTSGLANDQNSRQQT